MRISLFSFLFLIFVFIQPLPGAAESERPILTLSGAYALTTGDSKKESQIYLTIANQGSVEDTLIRARAAKVAERTRLFQNLGDQTGLMHRPQKEFVIPPGGKLILRPNRKYIKIEDLNDPLAHGDQFPLILTFEKSGSYQVIVTAK